MVMFTTVQKVNDLLGRIGDSESAYIISSGGVIEVSAAEGWIERRSGVINEEHGMNYQQTTVTDEYKDGEGVPFINTDYRPIISVSSLALYNGSDYDELEQGRDRNTDDYYIDKPKSGLIRFWNDAPQGLSMIKLTYDYGYATADIPDYVEEICTKMVAVDAVLRREFQEECKDLYKKFLDLAKKWIEEYTDLMNRKVRRRKLAARSIGTYYDYSSIYDLGSMSSW